MTSSHLITILEYWGLLVRNLMLTSMQCPFCSQPIQPDARFCDNCGQPVSFQGSSPSAFQTPMAGVCPQCQTPLVTPHDTFCSTCGSPLTPVAVQARPNLGWAKAQLMVVATGQILPIPIKPEVTIGRRDATRQPDVDVSTHDISDSVGRLHAKITQQNDQWYVEHLGSVNGTAINDKLLLPNYRYPIGHDDRLRLGRLELKFLIPH